LIQLRGPEIHRFSRVYCFPFYQIIWIILYF
jgi:hypothetical protein